MLAKDVSVLWSHAIAHSCTMDLEEQVVIRFEMDVGENKMVQFGVKVNCDVVRNHVLYCL